MKFMKNIIFCIPANIRINQIIYYSSCFMYVLHAKERKDKTNNTDDMPQKKKSFAQDTFYFC